MTVDIRGVHSHCLLVLRKLDQAQLIQVHRPIKGSLSNEIRFRGDICLMLKGNTSGRGCQSQWECQSSREKHGAYAPDRTG